MIAKPIRRVPLPGLPIPLLPIRRALVDDGASTVRAIGLAALAYLIWTLGDTTAKWAIPVAGVGGAMLWRGVFGAMTVAVVAMTRPRGWRTMVPVRWGMVLLRAGLSAFVSCTWYIAWRQMGLADTYAIGFTAPLLMTVLSVPMLGERIRWRRALSTILGFIGVLVMLRPGGAIWTPVVPLLLLGIVVMAITRIMTRQLSATETPECQAIWLMGGHICAGLLMFIPFPPTGAMTMEIWAALVFLGISSGLAHCVYTMAYGLAPVSALAPYEYTALLWGGVAGCLVFGEVPAWSTVAGAAIVAGAGLYNLHRERVRAAHERQMPVVERTAD
jgi:drug/metabolite transporter (DMT)-like permease